MLWELELAFSKKLKGKKKKGKLEGGGGKKKTLRKNIPHRWEPLMVKPGFLEHCLFVWILLCCSTAEKSIPSVLLRALKCPEPLEPQVQFTGKADSALCASQVPAIGRIGHVGL